MNTSRRTTSYSRPTTLADRPRPICPGVSYTPLRTPPAAPVPSLPARPEVAAPPGWTRSEHALHAAYPRTFVESTGSLVRESAPFALGPAPEGEDGEAKKKRIMGEVKGAITQRLDATMTHEGDGQPALWVAAERWSRASSDSNEIKQDGGRAGQGVSLVLTHANGFTKESWHPVIRRLLRQPRITSAAFGIPPLPTPTPDASAPRDIEIDEVWFLDDIHHGASVDLNAGLLGPVHNWVDGGRDIVAAIEQTIRKGSLGMKVIGIGHSFGANATVQAAHARPDLFDAILLVEPMCPPVRVTRETLDKASRASLVFGALKRRGDWPNIGEAAKIRQSPFFASWHPEAFDLWLSHGLVPLTDSAGASKNGAVQLATPKWGEAAVFAETEGLGLGWDKLAEVKVPVGFVMAGDATATDGEATTREMVWRPTVSANERFMDAGHLIVQEKPDELADAIRRFLGNVLYPSEESSTTPRAHL